MINYYPLPDKTPVLMEYQDKPMNADTHACKEILRLRDLYNIQDAVETGTCYGSTTMLLADNFKRVWTTEINYDFLKVALDRFEDNKKENINAYYASSVHALPAIFKQTEDVFFIFLDAHWKKCPLLDELEIIASSGKMPVICIHDFKVPGKDFGYDTYNNQPFELNWITPSVNKIYGEDGWDYHYNEKAEGAKRGMIFIYKK